MRCLLDTCTLIWLCGDPSRLSATARDLINDSGNELAISHVSFMEISLKWSAGKLTLPAPPRHWLPGQVEQWNLTELPMVAEDFFRITELPDFHKDLFDRLLAATAIRKGCTLITPDPQIHRFPVDCRW